MFPLCSQLLLWLCVHLFPSCLATVQSVIYEHRGQQVQWVPGVTKPPIEILWTHNSNKVVELDGGEVKVFGSFEGRISLDKDTGRLKIFDLRLDDSGTYQYEIYLDGKWFISSYDLKVIGKVKRIGFALLSIRRLAGFQTDYNLISCISGLKLCSSCFPLKLTGVIHNSLTVIFVLSLRFPDRESHQTHHQLPDEPWRRFHSVCAALLLRRSQSHSVVIWLWVDLRGKSPAWTTVTDNSAGWSGWAAVHLSSEQLSRWGERHLQRKGLHRR